MHENFMARIGARIKEFQAKMKQVDAQVRKTAMGTDKPIGADISEFLRKAALVAAAARALARDKVIIPIEARVNRFQSAMDRIATTIRSFDTIIRNSIGGSFLAISPIIVPIISSITGALGNLGVMLGTIAGSTFALGSAFGLAGTAGIGFASIMTSNLKSVFEANEELKKLEEKMAMATTGKERNKIAEEMAQIQNALNGNQTKALESMEKLSNIWGKITKQFEDQSISIFTDAMDLLGRTLQRITPLFEGSFKAVENLMSSLNKSFESDSAAAFFDVLNRTGGPLLEMLGKAFGNFAQGIMNMMVAFEPLTKTTTEGFLAMSQRFEEWSAGLGKSKGFQSFIAYVEDNMPKIRAIFRDAIAGVIYLFAGFSGSASGMMDNLVDLMARFKKWASDLGNNKGFQTFLDYINESGPNVIRFIANLTKFLVNLGIGLAPIGSYLLDLVDRFLEWSNAMMESNRIIGNLVGIGLVIAGFLLAIIPTIVGVRVAFAGLGTFILKSIGPAFNFLKGLFTNFGATMVNLGARFPILLSSFNLLRAGFALLAGPIGIAIAALSLLIPVFIRLWNENENFRNGIITAWNLIKTAFQTAITFISELAMTVFGALSTWWAENQQTFYTAAKNTWDLVYNSIVAILGFIWEIIVQIASRIADFWATHGDTISTVAKNTWTFLYDTISHYVKQAWEVIKLVLGLIQGIFQVVWPLISGIVQVAWSLITSIIQIAIDLVFGIISATMSALQGDWGKAWTTIKDTASNIMDTIVSTFENIDLLQIGKDIIQGLINGIGSMATAVWDAASNVAGNIMDAISWTTDTHSPSRETFKLGVFNGQGLVNGLASMGSKVKNAATGLGSAVIDNIAPKRNLAFDIGMNSIDTGWQMDELKRQIEQELQVDLTIHHEGTGSTGTGGSDTTNVDNRGLFEGANFYVRDDQDIEKLARQLHLYNQKSRRG
ncbi:phage tail protein [Jeotgalibacillus proteolyticus]|uniref:Phage tail tape measure protein n=1 Tax=Jeotgalibacillus proteolyticus TaxID=2082395 RepID=A0A2S5GAW4_9BACL|nr:hypothetical protein [Jeotgalibacillus proteolyticus]PPA70033.1 hypothetical protein C4B60_10580 [Jeotgalibacillus proteolyticus]